MFGGVVPDAGTVPHNTDQGQIPDTTQHSDNSPAHWGGYSHTWNTVQSFVVKVSMMFFRMKLMMLGNHEYVLGAV